MKPTKARIEAMREARGSWRPYGGAQWRLQSKLRAAGLIYSPGIGVGAYTATEAGKKWLAANDPNSPGRIVDGEIVMPRHVRLLRRLAAGDCPRASERDFTGLCALLGNNVLQRESANAADTREGYILTSLRHRIGRPGSAVSAAREWLAKHLGECGVWPVKREKP